MLRRARGLELERRVAEVEARSGQPAALAHNFPVLAQLLFHGESFVYLRHGHEHLAAHVEEGRYLRRRAEQVDDYARVVLFESLARKESHVECVFQFERPPKFIYEDYITAPAQP